MTMPNGEAGVDAGFSPWGITDNVSSLAGRTQDNVTSFLQGGLADSPGLQGGIDAIFNVLMGGFQTLTNFLTQLVSALTGGPGGLPDLAGFISGLVSNIADLFEGFGDLGGLVSALSDSVDRVIAFIQKIVDAIIAGIRGIPLFGPSLADALAGIGFSGPGEEEVDVIGNTMAAITGAVSLQQAQQQNFTNSSYSNGFRNPAWVCRYPVADVSYPEAFHFKFPVFGVTGAQSAGTTHTHPIDGNSVSAGNTALNIGQATVGGSYITISNTTVMNTVGVIIQKTPGTLNNVFLEVFRELADTSLVRLSSTNIAASIPPTEPAYLEVTIPGIIVQERERYMVQVRNSSTVNTVVHVQCAQRLIHVSPDIAFYTDTPAASATVFTAAEVAVARSDANAVFPCWTMLAAKNTADPDVSYSDDFNRANLGPDWLTSGTDDIVISGGKATYGGTTDGDEQGLYIRRTNGDASMVRGNAYLDEGATTQQLGLRLHCNREQTQSVELLVTGTDAKIYSYASGTPTQRATVATGGTDLYSLYYDEPNDKYVALKNGAEFGLEWASVGSAAAHGSDFRFGGIRIIRASGVNAGTIDNWTLTDYMP